MRHKLSFFLKRGPFSYLKKRFSKTYLAGPTMQLRLFVFFMALVVSMTLGIVCVLLLTDFFPVNLREKAKVVDNELAYLTQRLERQFGDISVNAVRLSQRLSDAFEKALAKKALSIGDLATRKDLPEELLDDEYETLLLALKETRSSGVFLILNATVDRAGIAGKSRAGLFIESYSQLWCMRRRIRQ